MLLLQYEPNPLLTASGGPSLQKLQKIGRPRRGAGEEVR